MAVAAFSHVALSVADLAVSRAFYADALGFTAGRRYLAAGRRLAALMETDPTGFDGLFLRLGDLLLELLAHRGAVAPAVSPRPATEVGIAHLSFAVNDLDAVLGRVEAAGGCVRTRMEHRFGDGGPAAIVFCLDPDGNRIELVSHSDREAVLAHAGFLGLDGLGWPGAEAVLPKGSVLR